MGGGGDGGVPFADFPVLVDFAVLADFEVLARLTRRSAVVAGGGGGGVGGGEGSHHLLTAVLQLPKQFSLLPHQVPAY